jgi:DNA-binding transcriptional ArsR family regulator
VSENEELDAVAAVVENDCTQCILVHAHERYMAVSELAERCDVSDSTIYRRLAVLREHDLIAERTQPDEDGHHFKQYRTKLDRLTVEVTADGLNVTVTRRESMARRLTDIVEKL